MAWPNDPPPTDLVCETRRKRQVRWERYVTILPARGEGDPRRIKHATRIVRPSALGEIAEAVVAYAGTAGGAVYVDRVNDRYRWSPATPGSPYPLSRLLARFLCCDHHDLTIGFVTVGGWCIAADHSQARPRRCVILEDAPVAIALCST